MKLFDEINKAIQRRYGTYPAFADLLIISKEQERKLYLEESILKSMDVADAFDIEVMVVDKLDRFRLFKEL